MTIEKRVKLDNNIYYIILDTEYKKKDNCAMLCLKDFPNDYYDGGDLSILIEKVEKEYKSDAKYDRNISFMSDAIYLYNRIPIISGIRDVYISKNDNLPYSLGYISKNEIEKYMQDFNIEHFNNKDFMLNDESTWNI